MEDSDDEKPRRKSRGTSPSYFDRLSPEDRIARMRDQYQEQGLEDAREADSRALMDLRMRADGSPSARRPAATLPVALWATVEELPDGGENDGAEGLLANYREWLRFWKDKGLYHGPTRLKRVNDD
jgi:hypothetical protein